MVHRPTKRDGTCFKLAISLEAPDTPLPHRRLQVNTENGEAAILNPVIQQPFGHPGFDADGNGKLSFEETMHRTCGTVAIQDGLLFVADFSGLFHCLDVTTGKPYWTYDMLAASWDLLFLLMAKSILAMRMETFVFSNCRKKWTWSQEINMGNSVYSTPIVANETLYIANRSHLFAIREGAKPVQKLAD